MLTIKEIKELIRAVDESSLTKLTFEHEGTKIKLKKSSGGVVVSEPTAQPIQVAVPQPVAPAVEQTPVVAEEKTVAPNEEEQHVGCVEIVSPMVGTFYQSPSPEAAPFVKVGDVVSADQVVCIVEAMKLFNEIEAECVGTIEKVLVKDGQLVEFGQPLFIVRPN